MADLTPLDEKLAEVLELAPAAQKATEHVAGRRARPRARLAKDEVAAAT